MDDRHHAAVAALRDATDADLDAILERVHGRPAWHADAACRGRPDLMFPTERGNPSPEALALCGSCPVRRQCDEAGRTERFGIWGGTRRSVQRERRARRRHAAA